MTIGYGDSGLRRFCTARESNKKVSLPELPFPLYVCNTIVRVLQLSFPCILVDDWLLFLEEQFNIVIENHIERVPLCQ
jgi:hypothetical protein